MIEELEKEEAGRLEEWEYEQQDKSDVSFSPFSSQWSKKISHGVQIFCKLSLTRLAKKSFFLRFLILYVQRYYKHKQNYL